MPWTPIEFFHAAANRLLVAARRTNVVRAGNNLYTNFYIGDTLIRPGMSLTNILIYPYNEYSTEVHRLLQLAVNLYDATTNRAGTTAYPHLPTVLRPLLRRRRRADLHQGLRAGDEQRPTPDPQRADPRG